MVVLLRSSGAEIASRSKGMSALQIALATGHIGTVELLLFSEVLVYILVLKDRPLQTWLSQMASGRSLSFSLPSVEYLMTIYR